MGQVCISWGQIKGDWDAGSNLNQPVWSYKVSPIQYIVLYTR